jgi:hypothetical protein
VFKRIAEIVGFVATCAGLYVWLTAPTAGLEADVYFADFELPPSIAQQFRALAPLTSASESRPLFFKSGLRDRILPGGGDQIDQMLNKVATFASEKAPAILHGGDFAYKGYWRISVRNRGSKSASSVVLHLPVPAFGVVSKSHGDRPAVPPFESVRAFPLGNVQGGDEDVVVQAWTAAPANAETAQKLTLTHDVGTGRVRITR